MKGRSLVGIVALVVAVVLLAGGVLYTDWNNDRARKRECYADGGSSYENGECFHVVGIP